MAYVPLVKHDVFISYPVQVQEWVECFEYDLRSELEHRLPATELSIHLATRGWSLGAPRYRDAEKAAQSAFLIAVFCPSMQLPEDDRLSKREWEEFRTSMRPLGPEETRFAAIELEDINLRVVSQFQRLNDNAFQKSFQFHINDEARTSYILARNSHTAIYRRKIVEVAAHVDLRLREIKQSLLR